ncbi:MAG: substrate-binding domain-containing protein, partial [Pseudomonadota bacterium]
MKRLVFWISLLFLSVNLLAAPPVKYVKIGMLVKHKDNPFFRAAYDGAEVAAKEIGKVQIIYVEPNEATAQSQNEKIDNLIAQKVDVLAISANDPQALVENTKKAMAAGIKVISWDSEIVPEGRDLHLMPSSRRLIAKTVVEMADKALGTRGGNIAILSSTPQAPNQNAWIEEMKIELQLKNYAALKLVDTVYG